MRTATRIVSIICFYIYMRVITDGIWTMHGYSNFGFMISYKESYKFKTDTVQYSKPKNL
jgi:hypothetical protein